jgi:hypothetical protein
MSELSSAAQAVITASNCAGSRIVQLHIAAALRAAADQVDHHWDGAECVDHLIALANELETQ